MREANTLIVTFLIDRIPTSGRPHSKVHTKRLVVIVPIIKPGTRTRSQLTNGRLVVKEFGNPMREKERSYAYESIPSSQPRAEICHLLGCRPAGLKVEGG